jgi:hypothetical protein
MNGFFDRFGNKTSRIVKNQMVIVFQNNDTATFAIILMCKSPEWMNIDTVGILLDNHATQVVPQPMPNCIQYCCQCANFSFGKICPDNFMWQLPVFPDAKHKIPTTFVG